MKEIFEILPTQKGMALSVPMDKRTSVEYRLNTSDYPYNNYPWQWGKGIFVPRANAQNEMDKCSVFFFCNVFFSFT